MIKKVQTKEDIKKFIMLPYKIYEKRFRNWVAPLILDMKERLDRKKNPFFEYSEGEFFIYEKDGEVLGRITAHVNHRYIETFKEKVGFFGFFESVYHQEVADALFSAAEEWLKEKGMEKMMGPFNFSTNEEGGVLLKGFDRPPVVMMTYNPEYYVELYENAGLKKIKELWAWYVNKYILNIPKNVEKAVNYVMSRPDITFRTLNMKDFKNEVKKIKEIYNEAWSQNWGFVPFTEREFEKLAEELKMIADPSLVYIVEIKGEPAAFAIALPDAYEILWEMKGRLTPKSIAKLIAWKKRMQSKKGKGKFMRVITLGVKSKFRKRGIDVALYYRIIVDGMARGYEEAEMSWILDDNTPMNKGIEHLGAKKYKIYGIYGKDFK